jgi:hypothetical protein
MKAIKVVFKSGDEYLYELPSRKAPVGRWTTDLNEAILFDAEELEDGRIKWPWHLSYCGDYSDGGEEAADKFRRYMFPAGRPEVVKVKVVESE